MEGDRDGDRSSARPAKKSLPDHRGLATWGDRLVPLAEFHDESARHGRELTRALREREVHQFVERGPDETTIEGEFARVAVFGGVYSNHRALEALLADASRRGAEALYCLGDLGAFGPSPENVRPLLDQGGVRCIQGNYEEALAAGGDDCNCGYTDPRDNHFAELSYRYTAAHSSEAFRSWMGDLPKRRRLRVGSRELLLVHGSPRRINEFLFESATPDAYLEVLLDQESCDGLLFTHTGLHWHRRLGSGRDAVNVGVIGRPANDGQVNVWYAMFEERAGELAVDLVRLDYDHEGLAAEMRQESLPEEFVETILTGHWTTCLEILPARERAKSKY